MTQDPARGRDIDRRGDDPTALTTDALTREIRHARELSDAKLAGVERLFEERLRHLKELNHTRILYEAKLTAQARESDARAIAAAFAAAEKAGEKSEQLYTKQTDNLAILLNTAVAGLDARMREISDRVGRSEGKGAGVALAWGAAVALIGIAIGLFGFLKP